MKTAKREWLNKRRAKILKIPRKVKIVESNIIIALDKITLMNKESMLKLLVSNQV